VRKGLLKPVYAYRGRGRPVKLYSTRRLSPLHSFGMKRVCEILDKLGVEYRVGRRPDVAVGRLAVEVETGKQRVSGEVRATARRV